jgi:hypothetical protein
MGKNVTIGYDGRVIWGNNQDGASITTNTPVVGYLDMLMRDHCSFQVDTGSAATPVSTLVGTLTVACSNNYVPPSGGAGQIPNAGTWVAPAFAIVGTGAAITSGALTVPTTATFGTAAPVGFYYLSTFACRWLRWTFVQTSGSGVLTVFANGKSLGG